MVGLLFQGVSDPLWIATAIKHPKDDGLATDDSVIDGVGESFREQTVKTKVHVMDTAIEGQ